MFDGLSYNLAASSRCAIVVGQQTMSNSNAVSAPAMPAIRSYPSWEASSTEDNPWPRGWHRAPARQLRCVADAHRITAGEDLWCTGRQGECYCRVHVHLAPTLTTAPTLPDLP